MKYLEVYRGTIVVSTKYPVLEIAIGPKIPYTEGREDLLEVELGYGIKLGRYRYVDCVILDRWTLPIPSKNIPFKVISFAEEDFEMVFIDLEYGLESRRPETIVVHTKKGQTERFVKELQEAVAETMNYHDQVVDSTEEVTGD